MRDVLRCGGGGGGVGTPLRLRSSYSSTAALPTLLANSQVGSE